MTAHNIPNRDLAVLLLANAMQHLLDDGREETEEGTHALHLLAQAIGRMEVRGLRRCSLGSGGGISLKHRIQLFPLWNGFTFEFADSEEISE
jgi:hypothetical protein